MHGIDARSKASSRHLENTGSITCMVAEIEVAPSLPPFPGRWKVEIKSGSPHGRAYIRTMSVTQLLAADVAVAAPEAGCQAQNARGLRDHPQSVSFGGTMHLARFVSQAGLGRSIPLLISSRHSLLSGSRPGQPLCLSCERRRDPSIVVYARQSLSSVEMKPVQENGFSVYRWASRSARGPGTAPATVVRPRT